MLQVLLQDFVATLVLNRPPNNFIDARTVELLADNLEALDADPACRAIVLAAEGKHFCAGANLRARLDSDQPRAHLYEHAARLACTEKPVVAAMQGAAVGAGLGLAMLADFRVGGPSSRFSANFCLQGYHPGFGLTATLPHVIGSRRANWMLLSGCRIKGREALEIGLVDRWVEDDSHLRSTAVAMASELAAAGPLAVRATRATLRGDFAERFADAIAAERSAQDSLIDTEDYREGVLAMNERRTPSFHGR